MAIRIRSNPSGQHGSMTVQLAIILVPVLFGLMAFAIDLGRLYLIRGELNQAASAMAMAAAAQLNGTAAATGSAAAAANALINSYNFGSIVVGQGNGFLNSATPTLTFFAARADAVSGGAPVDGTMAQYVSVSLTADAPLTFGGLFSSLLSHTTSVAAFAVAGLSAPLCTACDIDVFAVAPISGGVAPDFGFVAGDLYTFYFDCTGAPTPAVLASTDSTAVPYVLINAYNTSSSELEDQQLFQTGAQGLLPSPYSSISLSCVAVNQAETLWDRHRARPFHPAPALPAPTPPLKTRCAASVPASPALWPPSAQTTTTWPLFQHNTHRTPTPLSTRQAITRRTWATTCAS